MNKWMILTALLMACGDKSDDTSGDRVSTITALSGDSTSGEALYTSNCSGCHAADGSGGAGPALMGDLPDAEEIAETVINGKESMPSFDSLSDQDIADVIAYLQATF